MRFAISGALTHTRYDGTLESETVSARPVEHDMTKWYWDLAGPDTLHMGQGPATQHLWFKSWVPVAQGRKDGVYDDDFEFTAPYLKLLMNPTYVITAEPYEKSVTSGSLVRTTQVTIELLPQGPPTASTSS